MHYLYRHIRLDKNEVFYIGIGTVSKKDLQSINDTVYYRRAFLKTIRSNYWKNITNAYNYKVEIVLESDDYDFILKKEKEFIMLYGRKDLNAGTLVNVTDGGEGSLGRIISLEARRKMSESRKGLTTSNLQKEIVGNMFKNKFGILHNRSKHVYCIEDDIYFGSVSELGRFLDRKPSSIIYYVKNNIKYKNKTYIYCNKDSINISKLYTHFEKKI